MKYSPRARTTHLALFRPIFVVAALSYTLLLESIKHLLVVNDTGNPRVRQALPILVTGRTPTRNPRVFPDKTSPRSCKTDQKWPRYAKMNVLAIS
jgi:hypothetical protein